MTYLDHNHRKRENIRFLATYPLVQDLWCSPSRGVTVMMRGALCGIQVLSYHSEAEIRDARMTGVIHKDIWLVGYQRGGEMRF